ALGAAAQRLEAEEAVLRADVEDGLARHVVGKDRARGARAIVAAGRQAVGKLDPLVGEVLAAQQIADLLLAPRGLEHGLASRWGRSWGNGGRPGRRRRPRIVRAAEGPRARGAGGDHNERR